jgi:hypothetical protein
MDSKIEDQIITSCGRLITKVGTQAFSLEKLSELPEIKGLDFSAYLSSEEEVFEKLLLTLEKELNDLMEGISANQHAPSDEFEKLFKELHGLFSQKPYYLMVIFDKNLRQLGSVDVIISRIKELAEQHLTRLIDQGKAQNIFKVSAETNVLVKLILGSFQNLMNNMQLADNMLNDLIRKQSITD